MCYIQDDGGGGGGGDGWGWERTARNLLPNIVFLGMYFLVTSYGGDGWGGGIFSGEWANTLAESSIALLAELLESAAVLTLS